MGAEIEETRDPDAATAVRLATSARARARKRSGRMARGVTTDGPYVDAQEPYSHIIHEGFRGIVPNPFMVQAVEDTPVEDLYAAHVEDAVRDHIEYSY